VRAEASPEGNAAVVAALLDPAAVVVMVRDDLNGAPALAVADIGVALRGHGQAPSRALSGGLTAPRRVSALLRSGLRHPARSHATSSDFP
jgi:magnesium-transporting ATPase (P-type)